VDPTCHPSPSDLTQARLVSEHYSAPVHVPCPRRLASPALRSPSHDVCCLSNLPTHHSPLSRCLSGSVRQARHPRLAHMTNLVEPCDAAYARLPRVYARSCPSLSTPCTQTRCFLFIDIQTPYVRPSLTSGQRSTLSRAYALRLCSRRMHSCTASRRSVVASTFPVPMRLANSNLRPHMTVPELISVPSPSQRVRPAICLAVSLGLLGSMPARLSASLAGANPARPVPATPDRSAPQCQPAINCLFSFPPT
jgi:hypothetical protein